MRIDAAVSAAALSPTPFYTVFLRASYAIIDQRNLPGEHCWGREGFQ